MTADTETPIIAYKGFDKDLRCRGFQFEVGKTYEHDGEVKACSGGFHACKSPQHVFEFYPPTSRFCEVEISGKLSADGGKVAAQRITIKSEISLPDYIDLAIKATFAAAKWIKGSSATGDYGASSATGDYGASSATGYGGASSATGDYGASSATGDYGASSATGSRGASSATGYGGASSATGSRGASSATGYGGASSATGDGGVALASGENGRVMGADGCLIVAVERGPKGEIASYASGIVGRDGITAGAWYTCVDGRFIEVAE